VDFEKAAKTHLEKSPFRPIGTVGECSQMGDASFTLPPIGAIVPMPTAWNYLHQVDAVSSPRKAIWRYIAAIEHY
jgi:hypothetical protein